MKPAEYLKFYRAFVSLYGVITSDEAHKIIKHYYPRANKIELLMDMKSRVGKRTVDYAIFKYTGVNFLVAHDLMNYDDIDFFLQAHIDKPFYIPETLEELMRYSDPTYIEENKGFEIMNTYLSKKIKDEKVAYLVTNLIIYQIRTDMRIQTSLDALAEYFEFENEEDVNEFLQVYQASNNETRHVSNCGYTPNELKKIKTN